MPEAEGHAGSYPQVNDTPVTYYGGVYVTAGPHSLSGSSGRDYSRSGLETQMAPRPLVATSHLANKDGGC